MATETLADVQEARAKELLGTVRRGIAETAGEDQAAAFAMRRYIYIRLQQDERGTPAERKKLKLLRFDEQGGKCAICGRPFDALKGTNLHRLDAVKGYALENVELVHASCHRRQQDRRGYK